MDALTKLNADASAILDDSREVGVLDILWLYNVDKEEKIGGPYRLGGQEVVLSHRKPLQTLCIQGQAVVQRICVEVLCEIILIDLAQGRFSRIS